MTTVSVILPTYNERGNIGALMDAILQHCTHWPTDVLVVDDDSPDGTWQIVEEVVGREPRVRLMRRLNERGLTTAIAAGIAASSGDIVVWMKAVGVPVAAIRWTTTTPSRTPTTPTTCWTWAMTIQPTTFTLRPDRAGA